MGSVPKHRKITEELLKRVSKAESGEKLSTIRALMEEFDASQASIVRSLDELANQGLIRRRRGSGIYVAGNTRQSRVLGVYLDGDLALHSNALFLEGVHRAAQRESGGSHHGAGWDRFCRSGLFALNRELLPLGLPRMAGEVAQDAGTDRFLSTDSSPGCGCRHAGLLFGVRESR